METYPSIPEMILLLSPGDWFIIIGVVCTALSVIIFILNYIHFFRSEDIKQKYLNIIWVISLNISGIFWLVEAILIARTMNFI
jgi:uncharacterized protein with PQ loop repeat